MYEIHPDNHGWWMLYEVGDGAFYLVASFPDKQGAETMLNLLQRK